MIGIGTLAGSQILGAAGGAIGDVKDTVSDAIGGIGSIIGIGGGEKGSGQTVPNTLAWLIDKFDKANDNEALRIAPVLMKKARAGASEKVLSSYVHRSLGYANPDLYSSKWKKVYSKVQSLLNSESYSSVTSTSNSSSSSGSAEKESPIKKIAVGLGTGFIAKEFFGW